MRELGRRNAVPVSLARMHNNWYITKVMNIFLLMVHSGRPVHVKSSRADVWTIAFDLQPSEY